MYLEKLEFYKILDMLSTYCDTYKGKEHSQKLIPSKQKKEVEQLLQETSEAVNLSYRSGFPSFFPIANIAIELKKLESTKPLSASSLLDLAHIFQSSQDLKDYFNKDYIDSSQYPILMNLFSHLYTNKSVTDKISSCILDDGTIDDRASKALQSIRKQQRKLEQDIRLKLNDMIHSSRYSKYIQENIITLRNDRFVIPIKEEYRSQIKGFVHDISHAGSTVFIEPILIFEMNNELNSLKKEEELEIEKILQELSQLFYPYIEELQTDITLIGQLDFIFAKAKFSKNLQATTPLINAKKEIYLKNARHPFIDKNKVVPISLHLGNDFSTLLITGPNTGGKTVTLKTVGLLTCMACSGLNIPCDENSSIYVFDNIFADIGDDQSIANSLSTFSSHMLNIVEITKHATKNSLILVDELGSGTDPLEGANLAISILDYFQATDCLTIATTHYQELKQYALVTDGFENASVEFDIATLSPTYKLLVGIPGKSNAFQISQKLGLDESIIQKAQSLMTSNQIDIENLLKNIYDNKSLIEKQKLEISQELEKVTNLRKSLETKNMDVKRQEQELIYHAKIKARNLLLDAKEEATEMIKKINSSSNRQELEDARNCLNAKIKDINLVDTKDANELMNHESLVPSLTAKDIKPNMDVFVTNFGQNGKVLSHVSKSNEVQVQIGSLKVNVPIKFLKPFHDTAKNSSSLTVNTVSFVSKTKMVKSEINVIGLNVEESIFVVDKFLDDALIAKLETVRIVHGKGTGKLRNGIHHFLKTHPHVKSFRSGSFGEGEMGVTIVQLK
ncbi:MAG: endonuclease MutS2 [Clostridia bacterium]|nr:endonuclease MutS2 [Clostridia bacterium]